MLGTKTQHYPAKRQRRTGASVTTSGQKQYTALRITPATTAPSQNESNIQSQPTNLPICETISVQGCFIRKICLSQIEYYCCFTEDQGRSTPFKPDAAIPSLNNNRDQLPRTSLHDIETISIQGFFTCDPSQDRIVYSCSFMEERDPSTFFKHVPEAKSDFQNDVGDTKYNELPSTAKALMHNLVRSMLYLPQEDKLIVSLRAQGLSWLNIARRFLGQTEGSL
jgi:hypothetical protein